MRDGSTPPGGAGKPERVSFTVQTIGCMACTPAFKRGLEKVPGVRAVTELPMTNKVIVAFDGSKLGRETLEAEIIKVSRRAGFGDKVIFQG